MTVRRSRPSVPQSPSYVALPNRPTIDDLVDTQDVARILGLAQRNTVSEYQARYDDIPRAVINLGRGRSKLWIRAEIEQWAALQVARGRTRAKRRAAR